MFEFELGWSFFRRKGVGRNCLHFVVVMRITHVVVSCGVLRWMWVGQRLSSFYTNYLCILKFEQCSNSFVRKVNFGRLGERVSQLLRQKGKGNCMEATN